MPEEENRRSGLLALWTTLPGILTGIAAPITAVVGLVALKIFPRRSTSCDSLSVGLQP